MSSGCDGGYIYGAESCDEIRCASNRSSNGWERNYCQISPSAVITCTEIIHTYSSKRRCSKKGAYGVDGNSIWVDRGCDAKFNVCYKTATTTTKTTSTSQQMSTITTAILTGTEQTSTVPTKTMVSNSSVEVLGNDSNSSNAAVIGGAVCGAVAAVVLAIVIFIFIHRRTKARSKKENDTKKVPPTYDYAYANYPDSGAELDEPGGSPQMRNQKTKSTASSHRISTGSIGNAVYGHRSPVDSNGYLILEISNSQALQNTSKENEYEYAYSESPNVQRHSTDDYVNASVTSGVAINNKENDYKNLAKIPLDLSKDQHLSRTEPFQGYDLAKHRDQKHSVIPPSEYSLAKQTDMDLQNDVLSPSRYSLAKQSNMTNVKLSNEEMSSPEYDIAQIHEQTNVMASPAVSGNQKPVKLPKENKKDRVTNADIKDGHIYQNTKVAQLIAKMNDFHGNGNGTNAKNPVISTKSDFKEKSNSDSCQNKVKPDKDNTVKSNVLQIKFPIVSNSRSETDLNAKTKNKKRTALLPPKNRLNKSASTQEIYENISNC